MYSLATHLSDAPQQQPPIIRHRRHMLINIKKGVYSRHLQGFTWKALPNKNDSSDSKAWDDPSRSPLHCSPLETYDEPYADVKLHPIHINTLEMHVIKCQLLKSTHLPSVCSIAEPRHALLRPRGIAAGPKLR